MKKKNEHVSSQSSNCSFKFFTEKAANSQLSSGPPGEFLHNHQLWGGLLIAMALGDQVIQKLCSW